MRRILVLICLFFPSVSCFAWDATGHEVIAQIAFDNLSPKAKFAIYNILEKKDDCNATYEFLNASIWADLIKREKVMAFDDWHFIDLPFSPDKSKLPSIPKQNLVWAINQCLQVLNYPCAEKINKIFFLKMLIHLVGDAHQPLHCAMLVSQYFPNGDGGGQFFRIKAPNRVHNLHTYWDQEVGYFVENYGSRTIPFFQVRLVAKMLERTYPPSYFGTAATDLNPTNWAQGSFNLAKEYSYDIAPNTQPSKQYIAQGQRIVLQQFALAGYRLAGVLNKMFNSSPDENESEELNSIAACNEGKDA